MSGNPLPDIRLLELPEIERFFTGLGQKPFHARQVYDWLWKRACRSFAEMTNISRDTRAQLESAFSFPVLTLESETKSNDGTVKTMFRLHDGLFIEGVLIPEGRRTTACISSQAGCALACRFCATGMLGFSRHLAFTEIFDQVTEINRQSLSLYQVPLSNIVYMGMGEPLLNYDAVQRSVEKITSADSLGMSPRRITVSSVGIPDKIRQMADDGIKYNFALSLHAADNEKRNTIIPVNKKYPLEELTEALKYFHKKTNTRITVEYLLFRDFNDSLADASNLAVFCRSFPVKVNLIEYNPVENSGFERPDRARTAAFREFLEKKNMVVNIRRSRGSDIDAACGQLALKHPSVQVKTKRKEQ
jgi:23S rRNA (adenine2503-C2)-methyltransferase